MLLKWTTLIIALFFAIGCKLADMDAAAREAEMGYIKLWTNEEYSGEACFNFTRNYLDITDAEFAAAMCDRIRIVAESKLPYKRLSERHELPIDESFLMCLSLMVFAPVQFPKQYQAYAATAYNDICEYEGFIEHITQN